MLCSRIKSLRIKGGINMESTVEETLNKKYQEVLKKRSLQRLRGEELGESEDKLIILAVTDVLECCEKLSNKDISIYVKKHNTYISAVLRCPSELKKDKFLITYPLKNITWFYKCYKYFKNMLSKYCTIKEEGTNAFKCEIKE